MPFRIPTLSVLIAAALLHPACATSPMPRTCKVTGPITALAGMDAQAICDRFERDLTDSLGSTPLPDGIAIALTLHQRGAIDARLSRADDAGTAYYPVVSVDALDRPLRPDDLARLARAAAQVLTTTKLDPHAPSAAQIKGK